MPFGIGGNSAKTSSQSISQGFDVANAESASSSNASSFGQSGQSVFGSDLYQQLYGDAFGATGKVAAGLPTFQGDAATLFSGGTNFLDSLQQGDAGANYLTDRLGGGGDALLNEQIGGLSSDLSKFYNETLLPGITGDAVSANGLGNSRVGIAQAGAAGEVARQFSQGVTSLRTGAQAQKDAAAGVLTGSRNTAAGIGLGALPGVLGLSQSNLTSNILPQQLLASILGGPTTLTESLSGSTAAEKASSKSSSYGQNQAISISSGKSGGFNFGLT